MQMEFLKLDKERGNPPEELQSTHLSVGLSLSVCVCLSVFTLRKRKCPCTHLYTGTTLSHTPTHTSTSPHSPLGVLMAHTQWLPGVVVRLS